LKLEVFRISDQTYKHYIDPFKATCDCIYPITVRVKPVACAQTLSDSRNTNCEYIFHKFCITI